MNQDIKRVWVEALRSGKYKQGQKALRTNNTFCCLGVLCDLGEKKDWRFYTQDTNGRMYAYGDNLDASLLPKEIELLVDLDTKTQKKLAKMNDVGSSFDEIADFIEKNL